MMENHPMRVGVEIGGTFTDLISVERSGVKIVKVASVRQRPEEGVFAALDRAEVPLERVTELAHGSTVATNAVLERKGARVALLATEGFGDTLLIQRLERRRIFDLFYKKPVSVVPREDTLEIRERLDSRGNVILPLDEDATASDISRFLSAGRYEAIAICLLNSFANPDHERRVANLVKMIAPSVQVCCSYDISREYREYERATTTAIGAYVQPVIADYLARMEATLTHRGFAGQLSVMQSNGARMPAAAMRQNPVTALLSGPAAGVTGAVHLAGLSGFKNLITLDIGGTSSDVCLVVDGKPQLAPEAKIDGLPIRTPMVDIVTVGAGGGSIVWADNGGMMRVGPHSSGANPGPACYGRGGIEPTLTDAHVLCGRLRSGVALAGMLKLDGAKSVNAFTNLAERLQLDGVAAADSAVQIAVANVVAAIRLVSTERGRDPRDFALVPYGGAGPLHAAHVANALHISTVVIPPNAGVISAYGLLVADHSLYSSLTRPTEVEPASLPLIRQDLADLRQELLSRLDKLDMPGVRDVEMEFDMRFKGQAFEVSVPVDPRVVDTLSLEQIVSGFLAEHQKIYGHGAHEQKPVEIVSFRVGLHIRQDEKPSIAPESSRQVPAGHVDIRDGGETVRAQLLWRGNLEVGAAIEGPALVEDTTATIWVPTGWKAEVDRNHNFIMRSEP